jgi:hypothetical protein
VTRNSPGMAHAKDGSELLSRCLSVYFRLRFCWLLGVCRSNSKILRRDPDLSRTTMSQHRHHQRHDESRCPEEGGTATEGLNPWASTFVMLHHVTLLSWMAFAGRHRQPFGVGRADLSKIGELCSQDMPVDHFTKDEEALR